MTAIYEHGESVPLVAEVAAGIESISAAEAADAILYDLQGRRVTEPRPGTIYLRDNKKVILK